MRSKKRPQLRAKKRQKIKDISKNKKIKKGAKKVRWILGRKALAKIAAKIAKKREITVFLFTCDATYKQRK